MCFVFLPERIYQVLLLFDTPMFVDKLRRLYSKNVGEKWRKYHRHMKEIHVGVSENSVPLNPMVNDHYPY